jgi:hypothetical protein
MATLVALNATKVAMVAFRGCLKRVRVGSGGFKVRRCLTNL